ncbi:MAG: hypothetical protein ACR2P9_07470 [Gammaproteobacteria bacterium]
MADNTQTDTGTKKILPTGIDLSDEGKGNSGRSRTVSTTNYLLLFSLALVFLAALAVIFVLPNLVDKFATADADTANPVSEPTDTASTPGASGSPAILPWQKARQTELRKEAQDILADMLEADKILQAKNVTIWAEGDYNKAMQHAQTGDRYYNKRDFTAAAKEYRQAKNDLDALVDRVDALFEESITAGDQALLQGDAEKAHGAFALALAIDPIDRRALAGKQRAGNIDAVFALLSRADQLFQEGALPQAKSVYQQALQQDKATPGAADRIKEINQRLNQQRFNKAMSDGFAYLQDDKLEQAGKAFSTALRISPKSRDAAAALDQTRHGLTSKEINALLQQADELEASESWGQAMEKYRAALKLNANLATAQQGLERSRTWADIHTRLDQILQQPERLYDRAVFDETATFLAGIEKVSSPGEKFSTKVSALKLAIARADTPVRVRLQSDNQTKVTLYKVGELGLFTDKELVLRPGRYVAVGQREGYRDVRVEFVVEPDKTIAPVSVVSREKIALGR